MSQEFETRILEESSLAALSAGERLTLVAGLWSSLPTTAQILVVEVTAMIMRLPVPMADSELAIVLAGWPTLTATDKRVLTYVVRTESDDGR